jgi:hypothetical protein
LVSVKLRPLLLVALAPAAIAFAPDAHASGGLVTSPQGASSIAEVEIAVASVPGHTTRWARLRVKGGAGAFVWVMPVRPGGMIDLASDAWLEALEVSTAPRILAPSVAPPCEVKGGVDVPARIDHVATRAPSDVAIADDEPTLVAALHDWGFAMPSDLRGAVDATFASGSHLALLLFSQSSNDTMTRTVRVVDDAPALLPLVLTGSASGDVAVTAYVVDESRADIGFLPTLTLDPASIAWRADGTSSWRDARAAALAASPDAWLVESSGASPLFQIRPMPSGTIPAIADDYFARAGAYGDANADATSCVVAAHGASTSSLVVAPACPLGALARVAGSNGPPTCIESIPTLQLSPDAFRCGTGADDLAHAFALRIPSATWVTRAAGIVPAGIYGENAAIAAGDGGADDPIVRASKYDVVCSTQPGTGGGYGGGAVGGGGGSGGTPPSDPPSGAVVGTDDSTASDVASGVGDSCGSSAGDDCGGDSSSSSESSSSSDSCGSGSSTPSDSSGGCSSGGGTSDCSTTRRPKRSPFSRLAFGALAVVALLRRASRRRP